MFRWSATWGRKLYFETSIRICETKRSFSFSHQQLWYDASSHSGGVEFSTFIVKWVFPEKDSPPPCWRYQLFLSWPLDFQSILPWPPGIFHFIALISLKIMAYPPGIPTTFTLPPGIFYWYPQQWVLYIQFFFLEKPNNKFTILGFLKIL